MEDDLWVPPYWWKPPYDPMFDDFWVWGHGSGGSSPNTFSELSKSVADFDWRHELLEFEWLPLWWGLGVEKCSSCKYAFYIPFRASQLRWASFSALLLKNQPLPHEIMTFQILATTYMRRRLSLSILWLWLYVYTLYNANANMIFCDISCSVVFLVVLSWSQTTKQQLHDTGENLLRDPKSSSSWPS